MNITDKSLLIYLGFCIILVCLSASATSSHLQDRLKRILAQLVTVLFLVVMLFNHDWIIFFILCLIMGIEVFIPRNQYNDLSNETALSLGLFTCNKIIIIPLNIILFSWLNKYSLIDLDIGLSLSYLPFILQLLIYLVLEDLRYYWIHYLGHEVSFFWRFHQVHHGIKYLSALNGFRSHPIFNIGQWATQIALATLLGITPEIYTISLIIRDVVVDILDHANIDYPSSDKEFPWWGYILSTPNFHAWHHKIEYSRTSNLATMFPFWDVLFGTFEIPKGNPHTWKYGLKEYEHSSQNLFQELLKPLEDLPPQVVKNK